MSIVWIATQLYATQNTAVQTMPYRRMYQTRSTQAGTWTPSSASTALSGQLAACSTLSGGGSVRVPAPPTGATSRVFSLASNRTLKPDTAELRRLGPKIPRLVRNVLPRARLLNRPLNCTPIVSGCASAARARSFASHFRR